MACLGAALVGLALASLPYQEHAEEPARPSLEQRCPATPIAGSAYAFSVAGGGDLNGDGVPDLVVGSPGAKGPGPFAGRVQALSGKDGAELWARTGEYEKLLLGFSLCIPGDVDGDGRPDVAAGAPLGAAVLLLSGVDGSVIRRITREDTIGGSWFGAAVCALPDRDGDGVAELAIGAPWWAPMWDSMSAYAVERWPVGRVTVVSGGKGSTLLEVGFDYQGGELHSYHLRAGSCFGRTLADAGDLDGDGLSDLLVGAPGDLMAWLGGRSYGYYRAATDPEFDRSKSGAFCRPFELHGELAEPYEEWCEHRDRGGQVFALSGRDGSMLYRLHVGSGWNGFGSALTSLGDIDGDGRPDFAVGAYREPSEGEGQGAVHVYSGARGGELRVLRSDVPASELGYSLAACGDVDADGLTDLWVGDPVRNRAPNSWGEARLLAGAGGELRRSLHEGNLADMVDDFAISLAAIDDLDGDGARDLVVGVMRCWVGGRVYVYSSRTGEKLLRVGD